MRFLGHSVNNKDFSRIYGYSTVSTNDAAFIIGGADAVSFDTIAEYRDSQWRKLGSLSKTRCYHGSITIDKQTMILGGYSSRSS